MSTPFRLLSSLLPPIVPQPLADNLSPPNPARLTQSIKDWGCELGFQQVSISDVELGGHGAHLQRWPRAGYHGEMDCMAARGNKRSRPVELIPSTLRVISLRMDYLPGDTRMAQILVTSGKAYILHYALGRDYHKLICRRPQQLAECTQAEVSPFDFHAFVDSAPVLEKAITRQAGLDWIGKNTLVLSRKTGGYFFLSKLFVDMSLPVDLAMDSEHCGRCSACLDIRPTTAFVDPYRLNARHCISYLTTEYKGAISLELRPLIGNRVFGCDGCQAVCLWNRLARPTRQSDFQPCRSLDSAELVEPSLWSEEESLGCTEGSPLRRAGYERQLRNPAVGLSDAPSTTPMLKALKVCRGFPSELVHEYVEWALRRHGET